MKHVYIGFFHSIEQKFDYNSYDNIGNIPKRQSPFFPFPTEFTNLILKNIKNKKIEGRKVDYGAFVAKVNQKEILQLINEVEIKYEELMLVAKYDYGFSELKNYVRELSSSEVYALTTMEM